MQGKTSIKKNTNTEDFVNSPYICAEYNEDINNERALLTQINTRNILHLNEAQNVLMKASRNGRQFYVRDSEGRYVNDINDAVDQTLAQVNENNL